MIRSRMFSAGLLPILLLWFVWSMGLAGATAPTDSQGTKRALLIGINKYKAVPKLQGSLNDIETMRHVLVTRWGFPEGNIAILTDEQATRANMLAALEQLAQRAGPQDTVYIHYSGHGSQVEDLSGDEPDDHLDETLISQDGRSGDVRDITDDELDAIFSTMRAKSAFIVLDSCHSGTATRSLDIRTRSIPPDTRLELYKAAEAAKPRTRAIVPVVASRYVLMTGAASHQEALDGPVEGRYHGFFTYSLSKSLSQAGPGASPREILIGVERELKRIQTHFGRASMPEPQLEAPPDLLEKSLFSPSATIPQGSSTAHPARLPWLEVRPTDGGLVTLIHGQLLGAGPGSTWAVYPPGEMNFSPGRAVAIVTVSQIMGKDSVAKPHQTHIPIQSGSRAVALLPSPPGVKVPLRILDMPTEQRKQIEEVLNRNLHNIELVGADKPARFLVDTQAKNLRLLAADGLHILATFPLDNDRWGAGLAATVSRSANASELLTLDNPSSQIKIHARVLNATSRRPTVANRGIAVVAADTQPAQYRIRRSGDPRTQRNSLQLEIRATADSYLTIVDVDSEGGMNLLFPNQYQQGNFYPDGRILANKTVKIPDSLQAGNKAGFYWDYSPPKGTDTIRVFSSTDLHTAQLFRQHIQSFQGTTRPQGNQTATRSVSAVLKTLREELTTRGIITVADTTSHVPDQAAADLPSPNTEVPFAAPPATESALIQNTSGGEVVPISSANAPDWTATTVTVSISE